VSQPRNKAGLQSAAGINVVRTAVSALLVLVGIVWVVVYQAKGKNGDSLQWMADLGRWNYLIGFGLIMVGLVVASNPGTPLGRGRGIVVGMLGCFLLGLIWIVVYYVTSNRSDVWLFSDLGQWNLGVGIAFMATGFVYATKWQ
jgi:hypothetical protein